MCISRRKGALLRDNLATGDEGPSVCLKSYLKYDISRLAPSYPGMAAIRERYVWITDQHVIVVEPLYRYDSSTSSWVKRTPEWQNWIDQIREVFVQDQEGGDWRYAGRYKFTQFPVLLRIQARALDPSVSHPQRRYKFQINLRRSWKL